MGMPILEGVIGEADEVSIDAKLAEPLRQVSIVPGNFVEPDEDPHSWKFKAKSCGCAPHIRSTGTGEVTHDRTQAILHCDPRRDAKQLAHARGVSHQISISS